MARTAGTLASLLDSSKLKWVDPIASVFQSNLHKLFGREPVGPALKSVLNGTPIRHRLHPALVQVPAGAWTTSLYLDALSLLTSGDNRKHFESGSDAAIALGIVGSLPAAWSGAADWADVYGKPRRYGMIHALLNGVALASYSVSLIARRGDTRNQTLALASAGIGFAALGVSASIGGELVDNLGVNIPRQPPLNPPDDYTYVLDSAGLPRGEHRLVKADDFPILLIRSSEGELQALQHWCPHAGAPLSEGEVGPEVVTCHWHGSKFCIADGLPLQGPATTPLPVYKVRERDGRIEVGPLA